MFAYGSRAGDIGLPLDVVAGRRAHGPSRIRALPGFVDDFEPYPPNARQGASRSIYDS